MFKYSTAMNKRFYNYHKFTGRAPRSEMWMVALIVSFLPIIPILVLMFLASRFLPSPLTEMSVNIITLLATFPFYPILFATIIRRMHDLNWNGWWVILIFIELLVFAIGEAIYKNTGSFFWWMWVFVPPLICSHLLLCFGWLALLIGKGTEGTNDYGANPLK